MESFYYLLLLTIISVYIAGESRQADPRTTLFLIAFIYVLSIVLLKDSMSLTYVWIILLIGVVFTLVWAYLIQKGTLAFHKKHHQIQYLPYWLPILIAQIILLSFVLLTNVDIEKEDL